MPQVHLYQHSNEIKGILKKYSNDAGRMKTAFDDYMQTTHGAAPGSDKYNEMLELFRTKGGLKGYLEFMEI